MPNFNRTGPEGQGPMTGRRMGRCTNYGAGNNQDVNPMQEIQNNPNAEFNPQDRMGMGWRRGQGFGGGFGGGFGSAGRGRGRGMGRQNRFRRGF
ncbi:MAG: DUF5320 domain-containing protein [Bacteroidales bacterium]|nr:DUF5320 domain-containing protein [Bacteroidales bacterium]NLO67828.1 DUF5320 domain-containing protein [Bacteroidales bacterium]